MRSLIRKSIYAGLGLLGTGTVAIEKLGRELSKQADLSEKEGEKVARRLRVGSEKAVRNVQKVIDAEVTHLAKALHAATREGGAVVARQRRARKAKRRAAGNGNGKRGHRNGHGPGA